MKRFLVTVLGQRVSFKLRAESKKDAALKYFNAMLAQSNSLSLASELFEYDQDNITLFRSEELQEVGGSSIQRNLSNWIHVDYETSSMIAKV